MRDLSNTVTRSYDPTYTLITNSVIKNTYILLSLTLLFSAFTAWISMVSNAMPMPLFPTLLIFWGLSFVTNRFQNSSIGLVSIFALTGFMGYTLGPLLNYATHTYINGPLLIGTAFGLTGLIFLALSAYALMTKKDFNYLGGFLFVGFIVVMLASIANIWLHFPLMSLMVSGAVVLLSSGYILYETSRIINGGETNYIMATISLYMQIYNLFVSLLRILMQFSGRRD
ncbi:MAG: yccA [Francisellaceae bacterium]|nr:yccA [Francisellaceae bacterium]